MLAPLLAFTMSLNPFNPAPNDPTSTEPSSQNEVGVSAHADLRFARRRSDWRNGAVIYQVFVDRFTPPSDPAAFQAKLREHQVFKRWNETPKGGHPLPDLGVYSHELEFWGGSLSGVTEKLGYIEGLGADVLYLTPINAALTNHRYDTQDYTKIDPLVGTRADLDSLISKAHQGGMKVMLDGVYNHLGRTSPIFQEALANPKSAHRDWFFFGPQLPEGYRAWAGAKNLVELRLENPAVRDYLWNSPDSIVRQSLKEGIDGWRLDVGFEIGPEYLQEITQAAHQTKPGSEVVGEISGYPSHWFPSVDGVFNFFALDVMKQMVTGTISGGRAGMMLGHMVDDAGIENLLKSWLLVDNHDTPRLASSVPNLEERHVLEALLFTLPGSPVIYYGTELGMVGAGDPEDRAPMRWDLVNNQNPDYAAFKTLSEVRKRLPALRYGDFTALDTDRLLAFTRTTDALRESVIVAINPTNEKVTETFPTRIGRLMSWGELKDQLEPEIKGSETVRSVTGNLTLTLSPHQVMVLTPVTEPVNGNSPYNRVP